MKNKFYQKGLTKIIIAIAIGIVLVVGMFIFFRMKFPPTKIPEITQNNGEVAEQKTEEENIKNEQATTEQKEEIASSSKSEWKNFKLEKYGFSIDIPSNYSQTKFDDVPYEEQLLSTVFEDANKNKVVINILRWSDTEIGSFKAGFRQAIANPEDYRSGKISNMSVISGFISINESEKDNYLIFTATNPTSKKDTLLKSVDIFPDYDKNLLFWIMYTYPNNEENTILKSVNSIKFSK